jgi:hypothetical protein
MGQPENWLGYCPFSNRPKGGYIIEDRPDVSILRYPLVNYHIANWKITIFKNGKSTINGP